MSFSRGDFFHVIGRENDQDWYEACNPALPDARGLVPVAFFQALGRTERDSGSSQPDTMRTKNPDHDSGYGETSTTITPVASQRSSNASKQSGGMIYGIVMYDFQAERADELEAKQGDAIIVIAQSNPEWFVAKPIGRLGGPGLIPVSFIEIRDMASNVPVPNMQEAIKRAGIPRVEEWKKMAADYKNSSITLGKFEVGGSHGQQQSMEQAMGRMSLQSPKGRSSGGNGSALVSLAPSSSPGQTLTTGFQQSPNAAYSNGAQQSFAGNPHTLHAPVSAKIPRYCFAEKKYWFVIEVLLEDGRMWELSRYYEDFYDFQIALLTEFPAEAGNTGTQKRSLPYMPGPVNYVTDAITEGRLHNLDAYVKNLLAQPAYISRCNLVRQFFNPREGDYEIDGSAAADEYRLSGASSQELPQGLSAPRQQGLGAVTRQASSLSQPSQTSLSPGVQGGVAAIKIKLNYQDDLIAIRVPRDLDFRELYQRIMERLKIPPGEHIDITYKDDASGDTPPLMNNTDLDIALQRTDKLLLYIR